MKKINECEISKVAIFIEYFATSFESKASLVGAGIQPNEQYLLSIQSQRKLFFDAHSELDWV